MRSSWVLGKLCALVSGTRNVGACDIIEKVKPPYYSMVVEALVKIGGSYVVSQDLCSKCRCLSCFPVWGKFYLVGDFLHNLRLEELD